ncbi:MAG: hypothetical protein A2687_06115 [Candidatus Levybacteria bacterium RIFCSPHIGHO2_01_FULL_38_26]|nr:MAG: hypothetical protein A2687_06115 [Candidatus Levybacteria bacterium RIFCSPHIGHO2_01_FULL_38_26]
MNKKIALSAMSILTSLALLGGATFALFTDTATSEDNTFASGNADLQISLDDPDSSPVEFLDSIPGPNFTGIFPGESRDFDFWLKNNSSSVIDLDLTADVSSITPDPDGDQTIDNILLLSWTCDINGNGSLGDETPTAEFSPRDWLNGGNAALGSLIPAEEMFCRMTGRLPSTADSTVANQTVVFDVVYDATQAP